jgi:ABC-2 type transport system permease protein
VSSASVTVRSGRLGRAGFRQALRAEWLKLRTVRSTTWSLLVLVAVSVLLSALAGWESETQGGSPGHPGDNDLVVDSLAGILFGQIGAAVLGVLAITGEYGSGTIRTTFTANPRRRTVLAAKTAVVGVVVLVVGLATTAGCFLVGQSLLRSNGFTYENGYPALSLVDREPLRAVVFTGLCLGLLAVFSLGVGAILRHTAGAITLVLGVLLAPVIAIGFLPERVADSVEKASLLAAGLATQQTVDRPDNIPLAPWEGLAVVGAYAAVAILLALWLIGRRDA